MEAPQNKDKRNPTPVPILSGMSIFPRDTCGSPFDYETVDTMDSKKLEYSQESYVSGEENSWDHDVSQGRGLVSQEEISCISDNFQERLEPR